MRKIAAVAIIVVMLLPALFILPANDATAGDVKAEVESGESVPVTLYFHRGLDLDTKTPATNNSTTESLKEGAITFETNPLDKDLSVNNTQNFRVAFNITVDVTQGNPYPYDYVRVNLSIAVLDDNAKCASVKYVGEKIYLTTEQTNFSVDEELIFVEGWNYKFDKGDVLKVKITPEIEEHDVKGEFVNIALAYDAYMEYDNQDHLGVLSNVYCAPVEIDLDTYDKNDNLKDKFMPNLDAEECIIRFRGGIEDAFGYDDITEVNIEITGPNGFYYQPENNITENKTKEMLYEWDYSKYSKSFVADKLYTATITVKTVQHTFTQSTNFNFSAYGLDGKIDNKASASETILAGSQADYVINIKNTGASEATVRVTLVISVSPSGLHEWNITLADKYNDTSTTGSFIYEISGFKGGDFTELTLTAKSVNVTGEVGESWYCRVDIKIEFIGHSETIETLTSYTYLAPPYKISLDWAKTPDDPYYVLTDVELDLYVKITNMGTMPDTVNFTLNYTNHDVWDITLEPQVVNLSPSHQTGCYNSSVKLAVKPSSGTGEDTTFVNITAYSKGFWEGGYNKSLTRKWITLNLSRAFGISSFNPVSPSIESVDVKDSSDQATYTLKLETNDNTTHTVKLNAVPANKNITTNIPESVEVSKDSPENITLTVTCPQGMLAGDYSIIITASITQNNVVVSGHSKIVNVTVTVNPFYALTVIWADSNKSEITVTGKPGGYITETLRIKNNGNVKINSVDISPAEKGDPSGLFNTVVPSPISLSSGEEKNVTVSLYVPGDARDGDTFSVKIRASYGSLASDDATIIIKAEQGWLETLINTLYSMIHFIILLIAVIVAFIALWVKRR